MTKGELFKMLEKISDDAEITICPIPNVINWTNHINPTRLGFDQNKTNVIVLALMEQTVHDEEQDITWVTRKAD